MLAKTLLPAAALLLLSACGSNETEPTGNQADEFAARINGGAERQPIPAGTVAPRKEAPRENAVPGPFYAGTMTDPASATCGANKMGPYIGVEADEPTRRAIVEEIGNAGNVRFVAAGSDNIRANVNSPRLNLMLDQRGIIRDALCG